MKMSSLERRGFECSSIAQHRPKDVDTPPGERDEGLSVSLSFSPLAVVEGPGVGRAAQAGERREEEDPLEDLVAPARSSVVADPLAGVAGGRDQPGVGGELIGALKDRDLAHTDQELGPEDRTDAGQASYDPGLGALEKTARYLLVESAETFLEGEDLFGELRADAGGHLLGGQLHVLSFGRGESLFGQLVGSLDAASPEVSGEALVPRAPDLGRSLVAAEEDQGTLMVEVQSALEGREKRQERLSEAGDGAGLVDCEVASAGEEELQLGEGALLWGKFGEVLSHACLLGDHSGIPLVGLGLSTVSVASSVDGKAGNIDNPLVALPQQRQHKRRTSTGLVDGPDDLSGEAERLVDEIREARLVVFDPAGEKLTTRGIEHVSPVELLAGVQADAGFVHEDLLHPSLDSTYLPPSERPADGSLCSESSWTSPISISGQGVLERGRGAIPFKPSEGGASEAILGPFGRHLGTVPKRQTQR
jgi:hypothetical protein